MLDYIVQDFEKARISMNDHSIGGMVVCDSSDQAKMMFEVFQSKYEMGQDELLSLAAEPGNTYGDQWNLEKKVKSAALILHDIGTKDERKEKVEAFKEGKIDFLFVYNMLLPEFFEGYLSIDLPRPFPLLSLLQMQIRHLLVQC